MRPAAAAVAVASPAVLARGGSFRGLPGPVHVVLARRRWRRARPLRAWLAQAPGMDLAARARYAAPGMAHVSDLYLAEDVFRRPWGFLHVASTGHGSVVLDCDLGALDLYDAGAAQQWVAELGLWLALLTHEPDLAACTVTLDRPAVPAGDAGGVSAAGPGEVAPRPGARIQLTYRTVGPHGRADVHAVAAEVGARIPRLVQSLQAAGIATARAAAPASIAAAVRHAYYGPGTPGQGAPAAAAQEDWGVLRHGQAAGTGWTAASVTWSLIHLTSAVVLSQALPQVLLASTGHAGTRVSLIYQRRSPTRPQDDGQTWSGLPASLEGGDATALDTGHGEIPRFAMLVTTTSDLAGLRAASRGLTDSLDARLRPWLRPLYGAQAAGFAAGLPLGLVLSRHAGRARPLTGAARSSARPPSRGTTAGRSA